MFTHASLYIFSSLLPHSAQNLQKLSGSLRKSKKSYFHPETIQDWEDQSLGAKRMTHHDHAMIRGTFEPVKTSVNEGSTGPWKHGCMHARLTRLISSSRPGHHTFWFSTLCSVLGRSRFTLLTIQPPAILCSPVSRATISHPTSSIGSQKLVSVQSILRRTSFKPWQSLVTLPTVKTKQHRSSCISKDYHVRALRHAFMDMEQYGSTRADEEMADKQKAPNGGMKENSGHDDVCHLDRTQFERGYTVKALKLPKQCCSKYMKLLRG